MNDIDADTDNWHIGEVCSKSDRYWALCDQLSCSITATSSMASSCQALLAALKDCLMHSDCVLKQGNLPSDCLKNHTDELPEQCQSLRKAHFECKRGMVRVFLTVLYLF